MIITTTAIVEGSFPQYIGVATGEVIMGSNVGRDILI
ncbi:heavy metal-binding domain-containing protein [Paenibacillus sp. HWE-109]|nr:heavy metal-binding domain-containing protein [Paenibacillus sp. HWE-109]UKS24534.1 heavy metal-binding domain-containing protein [Paenibacillus sp. HWE-109]